MSTCKHCNKCKTGCDFCSCCGKCQRCDNVKPATVNPGPVFVPYPVYPHPWMPGGVIFRTEPEPQFHGATITCEPSHVRTGCGGGLFQGQMFTSTVGGFS